MSDLTENEARNMEASRGLNEICWQWIGWPNASSHEAPGMGEPPAFSTDWRYAGPLLEAIRQMDGFDVSLGSHLDGWTATVTSGLVFMMPKDATADTPQLAIARACAVIVANGITCEDVDGDD